MSEEYLTLEQLEAARQCVYNSNLMHKTPMLSNVGQLFGLPANIDLYLKLEHMQVNGSFKIRGVINQVECLKEKSSKLVTFSAGNYGRAFSYICNLLKLNGKVLLPDTASDSRVQLIESFGVETERMPSSKLLDAVDEHVRNGWHSMHPFDDLDLIAGYASIAFEIMETVDPDIVLVCCGGGGLVAAISCGLHLLGSKAVCYAVEPDTANTMYQSFEQDKAVTNLASKSIATGLAPPLCGTNTYRYCKQFTRGGVLLVTDDEIRATCKLLFEKGLKVEPSGCASLAALLNKKLELEDRPVDNPLKICCIVSGGNITAEEMFNLLK